MEHKLAHLEMIQGVINRMAGNSFLLKGWSVTLVSALFALAAAESNEMFAALALLPALAFWALDGYVLWQERLFRALYDKVRVLEDSAVDFSMNTLAGKEEVESWPRIMLSKTLVIFHVTVIGAIAIVYYFTMQMESR